MRALPLHNKEDVFNEWGAILRQQDEIEQRQQVELQQKLKLRQQTYKSELDKQYRELQAKKKGVIGEQAQREDQLMKFQESRVEQRRKQEEAKRAKLKQEQLLNAQSGFTEMKLRKQQEDNMREMEKDMYREKISKEEKLQNELMQQNKVKKKQGESDYYNMLAMQAREKQKKAQQEKETDKQFLIAETAKLNHEEMSRNRFFNKLKKFQTDNEIKQQSLMKYMSQDAAVLNR